MNGFALAASLVAALLISGCGDKTDSQLTKDAQELVKQELAKKYKPGECDKWLSMESAGVIKSRASSAACDNNFNVSKGLAFSDMKVYRHESYNTVCGNVSGYTDIGSIDGKFVFSDSNGGRVFIKNSKYPMLQQSDNKNTRDLVELINRQFILESGQCQ